MWRENLNRLIHKEGTHPAWGLAHCSRVYKLAWQLGTGHDLDDDVLWAAAMIHDLGAYPALRQNGVDHAARSAQVAGELLPALGFPSAKLAQVLSVIRGHMFYTPPADSPEARFFHDADVLEFMGAIGVARILSIVGLDDWTPDLPSAIKLLRKFSEELPASLVTAEGKALGEQRREEMARFLDELEQETYRFKLI
ncbi:MAG: HD domain-containing protein [Bacillota bacterium]|uniref:HD domain-containing protein n=1 Tax=Desulforudis sp. DRI-14 TaxID=3459793 RepID=UPI003487C0DD